VFNGDIGTIDAYYADRKTLFIRFDERDVEYKLPDLIDIRLAYAVSIHKYQGSECPYVIIPIHRMHQHMLNRNLLYTALTRGKRMVILMGQPTALHTAIHNMSAIHRHTGLGYFLTVSNSTK
jgi:exodeoxyribonuclease V alpha subunit